MQERNMEDLAAGNQTAIEIIVARIAFELDRSGVLDAQALLATAPTDEVERTFNEDLSVGFHATFSRIRHYVQVLQQGP